MFKRKSDENGSTLGELVIAMAIAAGCTAMVTPVIMDTINSVDSKAQQIVLDNVYNLQAQADASGSVTLSAEDFKVLTDKLTYICKP